MNHNFKELKAWQLAIELATYVYEITRTYPNEEKFGLVSQMRRAAVSIASNIAEGCGRGTDPQLVHFLDIAQGSAYELETQGLISERVGFLINEPLILFSEKVTQLQRLIFSLKKFYQK